MHYLAKMCKWGWQQRKFGFVYSRMGNKSLGCLFLTALRTLVATFFLREVIMDAEMMTYPMFTLGLMYLLTGFLQQLARFIRQKI